MQLHVTDPESCPICLTGLCMAQAIRDMWPDCFRWHPDGAARLLGDDAFLVPDARAENFLAAHAPVLEAFRREREKYLLYD